MPIPEGKSIVPSKWIYKIKHVVDGSVEKYKTRFVARGFSQKEGEDYEDTFAPVARYASIRSVISLASIVGWKLHQIDVKTVFLNGAIQEEAYIEQPQGQFVFGKSRTTDYSVQEGVDFRIRDGQPWPHTLLFGIGNLAKTDGIFVGQGKYIVTILQRFDMMHCKSMDTPMVTNLKKIQDNDFELSDPTMYRKLIGSLNYLVNARLDICYGMNTMRQFLVEPHCVHWVVVKHILRYLRGTIEYGLMYASNGEWQLYGFSNANWVGSSNDRKSNLDIALGWAPTVSWSSRKQTSIALSTIEVEYIVASVAYCEAIWFRKLFYDLFDQMLEPTTIYCDNQSCVKLSKNPVFHDRSKHIEIKYHCIQNIVQRVVKLKSVLTDE
eukprot:PITA_04119